MTDTAHRRARAVAIITVVTSLVLTIGATTSWSSWQIQRSQHQWCATLQLTLEVPPAPPRPPTDPRIVPTSEFGKELAEYNKRLAAYNAQQAVIAAKAARELRRLADRYHCDLKR